MWPTPGTFRHGLLALLWLALPGVLLLASSSQSTSFSGMVVGSETLDLSKAILGPRVDVCTQDGCPVAVFTVECIPRYPWRGAIVADPFGRRFEPIFFDGSRVDRRIELPAAGNWILEVVAPGYVPSYSQEFFYKDEGWDPAVISVRMKRGGSIRGTVVDESGRPIPGVEVCSMDPSYRYGETFLSFCDPSRSLTSSRKTRTDSRGRFCLPILKPGGYQIGLDHPGFQRAWRRNLEVRDGNMLDLSRLTMKRGSHVCGIVTRNGVAVRSAKVSLWRTDDLKVADWHYVTETLYTDSEGRYHTYRPLPPGPYSINAMFVDADNPLKAFVDAQRTERRFVLALDTPCQMDFELPVDD